jgi:MFS family permease
MYRYLRLPRFFYGWWIVGASFLIALYLAGVIGYGFTAIFEPIANEFGWSYAQVSFASSLRGMEAGLMAPVIGMLVDKHGPRRLIFFGSLLLAAGTFLLSQTSSLITYYGAFALIAFGMSACTITVLMTAVMNWFRKKAGIASSIVSAGFGFGGVMVPVIVWLVDNYGWRQTEVILGFGVLLLILPLSMLFRSKPEDYGYLPDGEAIKESYPDTALLSDKQTPMTSTEVEISGRQALRNRTFWHLSVAFILHHIVMSSITTHVMPYFSSIGVPTSRSSLVATGMPLLSVGGRLSFGWIGDRRDRRRLTAISFILVSAGMACFDATSIVLWFAIPALLLFGVGHGGCCVLRPALTREFFGKKHYGTVFGMLIGLSCIGNIIGPLMTGLVYDTFGDYHHIWLFYAGVALISFLSIWTASSHRG